MAEELCTAIRALKNNKASMNASAECLNVIIKSERLLQTLHSAITEVWVTGDMPHIWRVSRICCLFKKGDSTLPTNYRGLKCLVSVVEGGYGTLTRRQKRWYEDMVDDCQNDFRAERGTTDSVWAMKGLTRAAKVAKKEIYAPALDLKAAYD